MRRTGRLLMSGAVCAMVLVGCTPEAAPAPTPSPTAAPVFASEEEALAAAEAAYGRFLATMDQIFADGGVAPERLLEVSSEAVYELESQGFANLRDTNRFGTGVAKFDIKLQSYRSTGFASAYVCEDISNTDILDANGVSQVVAGRITELGYEVTFSGTPLLVETRDFWPGSDLCE